MSSDTSKGYMTSRIHRDEAAQLTNLTVPIPDDEDHYIIGLDVFHQLHCLVRIAIHLFAIPSNTILRRTMFAKRSIQTCTIAPSW